jgi:hypothetical protein
VDNSDGKLMPSLTAQVSFVVKERKDLVLAR